MVLSPFYKVVLWREVHGREMSAQFGQSVLQEEVESVKVRFHKVLIHLEEGQVGRSVEEVGQRDKCFSRLHVE